MGGIFTIMTAPIWIFCQDNPTFRKNNPFRKKLWQEQQEQEEERIERRKRTLFERFSPPTPTIDSGLQQDVDLIRPHIKKLTEEAYPLTLSPQQRAGSGLPNSFAAPPVLSFNLTNAILLNLLSKSNVQHFVYFAMHCHILQASLRHNYPTATACFKCLS